MGVLDVIRKKNKEYENPFVVQGIAVSMLADPASREWPRAIYSLSELNDREIRALSMLLAIESTLQQRLGRATVLSAFVDSYVLLKRSRKRRGEKSIIELFKGTRVQTPITLQPVKRLLGSRGEEE